MLRLRLSRALLFLTLVSTMPLPRAEADHHEWTPLFNGKNLDGWTPKIKGYQLGKNFGDTFRVEDGLLKVRYDQYEGRFAGRFGHLFYEKPFSNYMLRVEYRFVGEQYPEGSPGWAIRNSGVMIHGQTPATMNLKQDFPASIEVQLLGGDGEAPRSTANLCTPSTNVMYQGALHTQHCTNSSSDTYAGDQWVVVEIEVRGNEFVRHEIDGQTVLEYEHPQLDPNDEIAKQLLIAGAEKQLASGTISLQSESHPVDFRRVEIRELND